MAVVAVNRQQVSALLCKQSKLDKCCKLLEMGFMALQWLSYYDVDPFLSKSCSKDWLIFIFIFNKPAWGDSIILEILTGRNHSVRFGSESSKLKHFLVLVLCTQQHFSNGVVQSLSCSQQQCRGWIGQFFCGGVGLEPLGQLPKYTISIILSGSS